MVISRLSTQSRRTLDSRFANIQHAERLKPPVRGWIKAIREALGMSSAQLAKRLKISQPTIAKIEQSEMRGTIQLATLRRVAEAMNCTLVYALVPNESLETIVQKQARKAALRQLRSVEHTMLLEDQAVRPQDIQTRIDDIAGEINPRRLWDDP